MTTFESPGGLIESCIRIWKGRRRLSLYLGLHHGAVRLCLAERPCLGRRSRHQFQEAAAGGGPHRRRRNGGR